MMNKKNANKEKFKRAFSSVHISDDFVLHTEDETMTKKKKFRSAVAAACTVLALCAGGFTCYASNVGGIQRTFQIWFHGDQTDAVMNVDEGDTITHYTVRDKDGNELESGGGVAIDDDGTERPLTESEIQDDLSGPDTEVTDGHVYLYYKDQKMDLTGKFDEDGVCYVTLKDGNDKIYVTVTDHGGMATSPDRYVQKSELPKEWFDSSNWAD